MNDGVAFVLFLLALAAVFLALVLRAEPVGEPSQTWPAGDGDVVEVVP